MRWSLPHLFCYLTDDPLLSSLSAARAYYLSSSQDPENLTRAEATLQELIATTENQVPNFTFWYLNWSDRDHRRVRSTNTCDGCALLS